MWPSSGLTQAELESMSLWVTSVLQHVISDDPLWKNIPMFIKMRLRNRPRPSLNWKQEDMALILTAWRIGTTKSDYLSMWQWAANQLIESVLGEKGNDFGKRWTKKVGLRGKRRFGDHLPVTKDWETQASRSSSLLTNSAGTLGKVYRCCAIHGVGTKCKSPGCVTSPLNEERPAKETMGGL